MKSVRRTLLVELGYRGRCFHGVQSQPGLATVGGALQDLVQSRLGLPISGLAFSARTDAGVDAERNFATLSFRAPHDWDAAPLRDWAPRSDALWIHSVREAPRSLHARNCATRKHYRYRFRPEVTVAEASAPSDEQVWAIVPALDVAAMQAAARALVGTHDFSAFRAPGCAARDPVKTLHRVDVTQHGCLVLCDVEGTAFLRKMVRIMVGTLAEVGAGLREPADVAQVLAARNRRRAGLTAPARGLTLVSVTLDEG